VHGKAIFLVPDLLEYGFPKLGVHRAGQNACFTSYRRWSAQSGSRLQATLVPDVDRLSVPGPMSALLHAAARLRRCWLPKASPKMRCSPISSAGAPAGVNEPARGLVLDANILMLGHRVRELLEAYEDVAAF
jgi:hypothetical protein